MNGPPKAQWQFKRRLPIHDRMEEVVKLTLDAAKKELEAARKKLHKMQYGS